MKGKGIYVQQGDLLVEQVSELPKGSRRVRRGSRVVLRMGEATGHAHAIEDPAGVEVYQHEGVTLLKLSRPATVMHPEHRALALAPGFWRVRAVREHDHFAGVDRLVRD